jgi:molybdopterin molybdotransferase
MTAHAMMDGFAFGSGSGAPLRLVGSASPAAPFGGSIQRGECIAIRAGACLPEGCDTVAAREQCSQNGEQVWLGALLKRGANVRSIRVAA